MILGLIWTIILRFQIQDLDIRDFETFDIKTAKEALLLWCQIKTAKYSNVCVKDFTKSWRTGMAFNALIHVHRPDLINYKELDPNDHIHNLNNAFDVASRELGVPRLLDAEDVNFNSTDEKSIITYLSCFYHKLSKIKSEITQSKRIANIISQLMEVEKLQLKYEYFTKSLLNWIKIQINELNDRHLPNSLEGTQRELIKFKEYITVEKPPKLRERNECEAIHFEIQTIMKALGHSFYLAPEGYNVKDIERAWNELEKAENKRNADLRKESLRLEKLENIVNKFERKCVLRETYINEKLRVLSQPIYSSDKTTNFEATVKKHKAISAEILAQSHKFENLSVMAKQLIDGNYNDKEDIEICEKHITSKWRQLLDMLNKNQIIFSAATDLLSALKEAEIIRNEIKEVAESLTLLNSNNNSIHIPFAVEELLQRHNILEAQIVSQGETIHKLNSISDSISRSDSEHEAFLIINKEAPLLSSSLETLNNEYITVTELSKLKKEKLEETRAYYQFIEDIEEEEATICERQRICQSVLPSKDLLGVIALQHKHSVFETDIKAHENQIRKLLDFGLKFIENNHSDSSDIRNRIENLELNYKLLQESTHQKTQQLNDAIEAFQYNADANEAESWIKEKMQLMKSEDYGTDESSALALLQRHSRLESEIRAFDSDIKRLNIQSENMLKSGISDLFVISGDAFTTATAIGCHNISAANHKESKSFDENSARNKDVIMREKRDNPSNRKRLSIICNAEGVEERQRNINSSYIELLNLCNIKRKKLKDSIHLSHYNRECDGFETWIEETKQLMIDTNMNFRKGLLDSNQLLTGKSKEIKTALIANNLQLDEIDRMAELYTYGRSEDFSTEIQKRQNKIKSEWNQLNLLMNELENALTTVEDVNFTCNEMMADMCHEIIRKSREELNTIEDMKRFVLIDNQIIN